MNNQEKLQQLLQQPQLTEEDQQWLLRYLEVSDQSELKHLLEQHFEKNLDAASAIDNNISDRVLQGIHDKLGTGAPVKRTPVLRRMLFRVAAAAVILALVFTSVYFLFSKEPPAQLVEKTEQKVSPPAAIEIAPGTNGAILTISDGSKIILDSAHNGSLDAEHGSSIIKDGNQVSYASLPAKNEVVYHTMSTPRGRQYQLVLADGTRVWLNAASSIRFPTAFTGNERVVETTGELYFEVAKNASKPFKVISNGTEIEVLGTQFNVNGYDALVKTTLLEGSVKINSGNNSGFLKPGQQAQTSVNGELKTTNAVNLVQVMAWKNGRFAFEDASLESIMDQVSRWYDVDVVYENKIPQRSFTADISRNINLSIFLKVLEASDVHYKIEGKKLVVRH